jgi:hypothetical protein
MSCYERKGPRRQDYIKTGRTSLRVMLPGDDAELVRLLVRARGHSASGTIASVIKSKLDG